jgi:hypothetical protein
MNPGARHDFDSHQEAWLLLPWLANGRLPDALRERTLLHVSSCATCTEELTLQRRLCDALAQPERVSYAPGPSLARLLKRIDATPHEAGQQAPAAVERSAAAQRLPRLAWAATFLLAGALASSLAYLGMSPAYRVHSDAPAPRAQILHIAFARDLTIGEVEQLLRAAHAQVVEGPGGTGIFGVTPLSPDTSGDARQPLQRLAAQLRGDPRVRWVEPLPAASGAPGP